MVAARRGERGLLQPHPVQFRLQLLVLRSNVAQIYITVPGVADSMPNKQKCPLKRGHQADHPIANQSRLMATVVCRWTSHLHGKAQ